jgi:hypothetical protein
MQFLSFLTLFILVSGFSIMPFTHEGAITLVALGIVMTMLIWLWAGSEKVD